MRHVLHTRHTLCSHPATRHRVSMRFLSRATTLFASLALLSACAVERATTAPRASTPELTPRHATNASGPNLWIVELMADPSKVADAGGEWVKLYNPGPVDVSLDGVRLQSASGTNVYSPATSQNTVEAHTISAPSLIVAVGTCVVIGNSTNTTTNGGVTAEVYSYGTNITLGNNNTDWVSVKTAGGLVLDSVAYSPSTIGGTTTLTRTLGSPTYSVKAGISRVVADPSLSHTELADAAKWADTPAATTYGLGDRGTPNTCTYTQRVGNGPTTPQVAVAPNPSSILVNGTSTVTATVTDNGAAVTPTNVAWSVAPAGIVTLSATTGASITVTGAAAGSATITAIATYNGTDYTGTGGITVTSPTINWIDVSSSSASYPAGYQTQLFATARVASGGTIIPSNFTFQSLDPTIATVQTVSNTAIVTGVSGSATKPRIMITATPVNGGSPYTFTTTPITIEVETLADSTTTYGDNVAFGLPTPASQSNPDDFLIKRPQYALSYNQSRGTPNWVGYELDARQSQSGTDRCNCFTADPLLPLNKQIFTSDYTSGGYDRGHMTRSADRTLANGDNARTFYLTNVVPQQADLNQGVWAQFENALADSARNSGKAVYIMTGPQYNAGAPLTYIKNQGKIAIPDSTWKVALIVKRRADGTPYDVSNLQAWANIDSVTVLAVMMPNVAGIRNDPPSKYYRTVDQVEAVTGLNFLALLPTAFQNALEAGDRPPVAVLGGATTGNEGQLLGFNATASTDPDQGVIGFNEVLSFTWTFGDGTTAIGGTPSKSYLDNGSYTVSLTVTDKFGWPRTATRVLPVSNVTPVTTITPAAGYGSTVQAGATWAGVFRFTDPGKDAAWKLSIAWGDGTTFAVNTTTQTPLTRGKVFTTPGQYTVRYIVTDKDGAASVAATYVVTVTP